MKFRDDIDPANTWVVSDTHFGHDNIVGFCHRPLDHEQVMIAEWRAHVPDDATLLHLGDLSYRNNAHFQHIVAPELTGLNKKIILGNHDKQRSSFYRRIGFQVCKPFHVALELVRTADDKAIKTTGLRSVLPGQGRPDIIVSFSHYPWSDEEEGSPMPPNHWRLHGHIHNNGYSRDQFVPFLKNHINLSVEQTKYRPVNLKLLLEAAILGVYPETTEAQQQEARDRKAGKRA